MIFAIWGTILIAPNMASAQLGEACEVAVMRSMNAAQQPKDDDEIVSPNSLISSDHVVSGFKVPTFLPAGKYVFSKLSESEAPAPVYKNKGDPILAVLCESNNMVPNEFDIKLVSPSVPLYLSQDFDDVNADLMKIVYQAAEETTTGAYIYDYSGRDLTAEQIQSLTLRLKKLNDTVKAQAQN